MEMKTLFSVPVGISNHKEIIPDALELFKHEYFLHLAENGSDGPFWTSLKGYNKRVPAALPDDPAVDVIVNVLEEEVTNFAKLFGYDVDKYDFEVVNLWMNAMSAGSKHTKHSHYGYTFSGCFYVDIPKNSGLITFHSPNVINKCYVKVKDWTTHASTEWTLEAKQGDIIIWESYLQHEVPTLIFDNARLSMAFDVNVYLKED